MTRNCAVSKMNLRLAVSSAVMTSGLASVAGTVLLAYSQMGADLRYLLAASFMAAPGGLLYAKLLKPERDKPEEVRLDWAEGGEKPVNVLDADGIAATANPVTFGDATAGNGIPFTGGAKLMRWGRLARSASSLREPRWISSRSQATPYKTSRCSKKWDS